MPAGDRGSLEGQQGGLVIGSWRTTGVDMETQDSSSSNSKLAAEQRITITSGSCV